MDGCLLSCLLIEEEEVQESFQKMGPVKKLALLC